MMPSEQGSRYGYAPAGSCKSGSYKTPRLPPVLFQQFHIGHRHTPVNGFGHIVDGEQGYMDGGQKKSQKPRFVPNSLGSLGQDWDKNLPQMDDISHPNPTIVFWLSGTPP